MSERDSFIEEVTEEVRRDKLFALYRRYGWIAGAVVVVVVGTASFIEWRNYTNTQASQGFGDAIMAALVSDDIAKRALAIKSVSAPEAEAKPFLALLQAAVDAENSDRDGALALLDQVAKDDTAPELYRSLASLKAVILRGADQDRTARLAELDRLATPGNPFRVLAMEQKALALVEFGNNDEAIALLLAILDEPGATQDLIQRVQRLIVALGGELPAATTGDTSNG